jgi:hypothetical protein
MLAAGKKFAELAARKHRPQPQRTQPEFWPASQGGINAVTSAALAPPTDALVLTNMVPSEYGVVVRKGYIEHCQPVAAGDGIKTLIPFEPAAAAGVASPRLFACTSDGIYDCTVAGEPAVKSIDFANKDVNAGWCSWTHYASASGQYVLLCDESNGYYVYTAATNSWAKVAAGGAGIIGADPGLFCFVMVWKHRVWFVERNSGKGWYLAPDAIFGSVTAFYFGRKFRYGGHLRSLWNWTMDGGEGVDDYLAVIGSAGDLAIYRGTDPTSDTTFASAGWWYIGRPTEGRRQGGAIGGDLLLLTSYGILQASKIITGLPITDEQVSMSYKINPRVNAVLQQSAFDHGWKMTSHLSDQLVLLLTPQRPGYAPMQFVYNTATRAWAQFVDLPMKTSEVWRGKLYFGSHDNRIYVYDGHLDGFMLADDGASADSIEWNLLTSYQPFGPPSTFKRVQFLRPQFITTSPPSYLIEARYDFDLTALPGSPAYTPPDTEALWDQALWDTSVWSGGYVPDPPPRGGTGLGRRVAVVLRGRSAAQTTHVGTDVLFDQGGML